MKLRLYHGRIDPSTGGTDLDGNLLYDDWGFEGPTLEGIEAVDFTYGNSCLVFKTPEAYDAAERATEWDEGVRELSLEIRHGGTGDCVKVYNSARARFEYFGDYMLTED